MPKRAFRQPGAQQAPAKQETEKLHLVEITLAPPRDIPIQWANAVIVNFLGAQFFVNIVSATPDPWTRGQKAIPSKVEGKVLARYAFSVLDWAVAVESFSKQIQRLKAEGALGVELVEEIELEEPQ